MERRRSENVFRKKINGDWCVYCGEVATTKEHFPPVSISMRGYILPACRECNISLGAEYGRDFTSRYELAKRRIGRKHSRALCFPDWSNEEIKELSHSMQSDVKKWIARKKKASNRLNWNVEAYIASIDKDGDFISEFLMGGSSEHSSAA